MPLDALHIRIATNELNDTLYRGRVDKITAPSFGAVRFVIYSNHKTHGLYISINPENTHIRLTSGERQELSSVPVFVTHLKKHLIGATIERIYCIDNERIINIEFLAKSELGVIKKLTIVAELMGKHSNLILLNENNKIQESFKHIPLDLSSKRQILPGLTYTVAPPQENKINPFDKEALLVILSEFNGGSLSLFLQKRVFGLAPASIREVVYLAFGDNSPTLLNKESQEKLTSTFTIFSDFTNSANYSPCFSDNDFYFRPYLHLGENLENLSETPALLEAMDGYYSIKNEKSKFNIEAARLNQIVKVAKSKSEKRLALLLERQLEAENLDEYKIKGELLTANLYRINKNDTALEVDNYYVDPPTKIKIELQSDVSPTKQADNYFKKYRKAKKTLEVLVPQLQQTKDEIEYLETVAANVDKAESLEDLAGIGEELVFSGYGSLTKQVTKKKDRSKPKTDRELLVSACRKDEFMGFIILTGKNNLQNDALIKTASPEDIWLHTKDFHGSHTVIINPKKVMPSEIVLKYAGNICAKHSKAKLSDSIPIDYTFIKFVSKPKGAKAGKVVYINQKTIWIKPQE